MIRKLHAILDELAARRQRQRLHGGLAIAWWSGLLLGWWLWSTGIPARSLVPPLAAVLLITSVAIFFWSRRGLADPRGIARHIESKHPELKTALLAALDQNPQSGPLSYLQIRVIVESVAAAERDQWTDLVPGPRLARLRVVNLAGIVLLLAAIAFVLRPVATELQVESRQEIAAAITEAAILDISVDPGDVEIERGSPLTIQARFGEATPVDATLQITDETGLVRKLPLTRPFTDPVYQARLAAVAGPMDYKVVTAAGSSRSYHVRVFDLPAMQASQVVLTFPAHLAKPPETIKDPRSIQVPQRTRMDFSLVANLPGLSATFVAKNKEPLKLTADPTNSARYLVSIDLIESVRYEIVLTDSAGRRNARKDLLDIKVLPNKAPVVKVVLPQKNEKATPIQEVRLEAKISDDTGLLAQGLRYTLDGEKWEEIETSVAAGEKLPPLSQLIDLEAAGAKPKDVLMWNAWAEDIGPDGRKRRVNGDIHIVRVRDFDEEFYQQAAPPGDAPPGGEQGAGGAGAELLKTQTQILNATWSLRRDHAEISDTAPDSKDLETLRRSQEITIETAAALEAEQTDPAVRQFITDARLAMKDALADLTAARDQTSAGPLEPAIGHEQAALRHLYQLMSSKTMIMTGQSPSSESSSSEERPPGELDLKPMENPYQAEKQAKPETPAGEAGEAMEILKRLDELAKRQRDLNEEMKALQNALDEATTPEKKAEVERQLKQLREQQRELLADVDQLREKTSDPAQQATEQRQNEALDEAREKAQQANEQLGESKLGEALAAGRRAQEALEGLHEDFRETSAARLAGQLRELRQDARDLEERQQRLADGGEQAEKPQAPRLKESAGNDPEIARQREDLQKLLDAMKETAESAERAEPLVAQDLAEALRQADQNRVAQSLEQMQQAGQNSPAAERAAEGIADLTREIEGAAERILGNEAQALRYARDELQRLADQASGEAGKEGEPGEGQAGNQPGEGREPGQAPGEGQPGEQAGNQPGEGREPGQASGEGQPGGQAGNQPGEGNEPGQAPGQGQPGEQAGNQPGEGNEPGQVPGQGQPGEQAGNQPGEGRQPGETAGGRGEGGEPGQGQGQGESPGQPGQGEGRDQASSRPSGQGSGGGRDGRGGNNNSPITGDGFEEWSDRLYDLEAIVEDPDAQSAVARARQASREMRKDFKRHSVEPDQDKLANEVVRPLAEAARKLDARLRELDRKDPLAPVGREPVPERYNDIVRRYFEELGK